MNTLNFILMEASIPINWSEVIITIISTGVLMEVVRYFINRKKEKIEVRTQTLEADKTELALIKSIQAEALGESKELYGQMKEYMKKEFELRHENETLRFHLNNLMVRLEEATGETYELNDSQELNK